MSSRSDNLRKCHRCPLRAVGCAGPCACTVDGKDIIAHAGADGGSGFCPHPDGPRYGAATAPPGWDLVQITTAVTSQGVTGDAVDWRERARALWLELHRVALAAKDRAAFARYVRQDFTPRVPCRTCKPTWLAILERMPPEDAADPFAWSVDAHNAVNVELDPPKPVVSLEEARRLHEPTTGGEGDDRGAVEARSIDN